MLPEDAVYEIGPYNTKLGFAADIVSSVLLSTSVLASSIVLIAVYHVDNKYKLRSRVIIGLFTSHVWAGCVFLAAILSSLAGHPPVTGSRACAASAFLVESSIWAQYVFTIILAAVSYCIILYPISRTTSRLERYWYILFILAWGVAIGMAGLQFGLYRSVYIGGFCWNGTERNAFNELIGCLPRVVVFLIILALYWKIHWYLKGTGKLTVMAEKFMNRKLHLGEGALCKTIPNIANDANQQNTDNAPWEDLYLSGLSAALMLNNHQESTIKDHGRGHKHAITAQESKLEPLSYLNSGTAQSSARDGDIDTRLSQEYSVFSYLETDDRAVDIDEHRLAAISISDTLCSWTTVESESSEISMTMEQDLALARDHCNAFAAGVGHTPYKGPVPVAKRKAKREHYESLQDLLTRRAALLFLLFPLTYFILTVISMARLIDDYAAADPSRVMRAISRWTLFLQGFLDAVTYGLIAFKVKRDVGEEIGRRWADPDAGSQAASPKTAV